MNETLHKLESLLGVGASSLPAKRLAAAGCSLRTRSFTAGERTSRAENRRW